VEPAVACHFIEVVGSAIAQDGQEVQVGVEARMAGIGDLDSLKKKKKRERKEKEKEKEGV
jgi:hypothetical protein